MKPTKLGKGFGKMMVECPAEISQYAVCVGAHSEGGTGGGDTIAKHACDQQFQRMLSCFRKVRKLK